jgi:hypothetical protein
VSPCEDQVSPGIEKAFSPFDLWTFPQEDRADPVTVRLRSPYGSPRVQLRSVGGPEPGAGHGRGTVRVS